MNIKTIRNGNTIKEFKSLDIYLNNAIMIKLTLNPNETSWKFNIYSKNNDIIRIPYTKETHMVDTGCINLEEAIIKAITMSNMYFSHLITVSSKSIISKIDFIRDSETNDIEFVRIEDYNDSLIETSEFINDKLSKINDNNEF